MTISIASRTQPKKREKRQKRCRVPWNKGIKFLLCLTGVREKGREIVFLPRRIYRGGIVLGKNETRFLLNYAPADSVSRVSDLEVIAVSPSVRMPRKRSHAALYVVLRCCMLHRSLLTAVGHRLPLYAVGCVDDTRMLGKLTTLSLHVNEGEGQWQVLGVFGVG